MAKLTEEAAGCLAPDPRSPGAVAAALGAVCHELAALREAQGQAQRHEVPVALTDKFSIRPSAVAGLSVGEMSKGAEGWPGTHYVELRIGDGTPSVSWHQSSEDAQAALAEYRRKLGFEDGRQ